MMSWYRVSGWVAIILMLAAIIPGQHRVAAAEARASWAERLGFPPDQRVLILHADDMGMCEEANGAIIQLLENHLIQSASAMAPCPAFEGAVRWALAHPEADVGLHLTLTSEWKTHRWGPVAEPGSVPGLIDPEGFMWRGVLQVAMNATPAEVERELRAQIEKCLALGWRPSHIDTHMGTVYALAAYTEVYLRLAEEYQIPAMVIDLSNPTALSKFSRSGYPLTARILELIEGYSLPKLDDFCSLRRAGSYEEFREGFMEQVRELRPGLTEMVFHPQLESDTGKTITNSWRQRAWEAELFGDPLVRQFLAEEGIVFTNWREVMERFRGRAAGSLAGEAVD